jgi:4-diphosphocytidyl-2-C-methyl-D-erythritol kinase
MVPLKLADRITMEIDGPSGSVSFSCSDATVPQDGSNLVLKAVAVFRQAYGSLPGLVIHLEKAIPHGAGMGGGSSDAATTLELLNELTGSPFSISKLSEMAASIGSDIPFFLHHCVCDCEGRGEIVVPRPEVRFHHPILLIKLPFGVPTPWAYQRWKDSNEIAGVDYAPIEFDGQVLVNDLERPVFEKHLVLAMLKTRLRMHPAVQTALMSGSGSTVFAILRDFAPADALQAEILDWVGPEVWMCQTETLG